MRRRLLLRQQVLLLAPLLALPLLLLGAGVHAEADTSVGGCVQTSYDRLLVVEGDGALRYWGGAVLFLLDNGYVLPSRPAGLCGTFLVSPDGWITAFAAAAAPSPTPGGPPTPTRTPAPTRTPTPTRAVACGGALPPPCTPTITQTEAPTWTPSPTPSPSLSPTASPTDTPSPIPTDTSTPTDTATPTLTPRTVDVLLIEACPSGAGGASVTTIHLAEGNGSTILAECPTAVPTP